MSGLGDKLRDARQRKNLTLTQAQRQTRIHSTVLKALEDGKCDSILNPTYVKSFLRKYCDFLGLDTNQVLNEYRKLHPETESRIATKLPEPEASSSRLSKMVPVIRLFVVGAIALVAIALAGGKVASYFKKPAAPKPVTVSKAKRPAAQVKPSGKTQQKPSTPKKNTEVAIPKNVQLKLLLKVNRNVFIKMRTDGVLLFERVLTQGTAEMFTADNVINIYAARGEFIELMLNGKALGSPGRGVLENIEITRTGIKIK